MFAWGGFLEQVSYRNKQHHLLPELSIWITSGSHVISASYYIYFIKHFEIISPSCGFPSHWFRRVVGLLQNILLKYKIHTEKCTSFLLFCISGWLVPSGTCPRNRAPRLRGRPFSTAQSTLTCFLLRSWCLTAEISSA